jgi:DNA-binding winged helix-turn-helix (wHTH) protein
MLYIHRYGAFAEMYSGGKVEGYRFESFELCVRTREVFDLRRTAPLRLEPKMFEVLLYLIEHRARIVLKDELVDEVWGGLSLSSGVVPQCICMLRKALGDTGRSQRILKTHYGHGYRFVCSAVPADFDSRTFGPGIYESSTAHLGRY